jgi:hypothetical protein
LTASKQRTLTWTTKDRGSDTLITFNGNVDESTDFSPLEQLQGNVTFDLAGIKRFNSEGVRRWIILIRKLDSLLSELTFVRCSLPVVTQLNLIRGFQGKASVKSFYAPYVCNETGDVEERLLIVQDIADPLNPPVFHSENGDFELDDIAERYFSFLRS